MALYEIRRLRPGPFDRIDKYITSIVSTIWEDINNAVVTNNDTVRALRNTNIETYTEGTSNLLDKLTWVIMTLQSPTEDEAIRIHRNIQVHYQAITSDLQAIIDDLEELSFVSDYIDFNVLQDSVKRVKSLLDWQGKQIQDNLGGEKPASQLVQAVMTRFLYSTIANVIRTLYAVMANTKHAEAPAEEQRMLIFGDIVDTSSAMYYQLFREIGDLVTYIEGRFQTLSGFTKEKVIGWINEEINDKDSDLRETLNSIIDARIEMGPAGGEGEEVTIPEEYITETELATKLADYVKKEEGEEEGFQAWKQALQNRIERETGFYYLHGYDWEKMKETGVLWREQPEDLKEYISRTDHILSEIKTHLQSEVREQPTAMPGFEFIWDLLEPVFEEK